MDNTKLLGLLELQRDSLYARLRDTSISQLYKDQYDEIESGEVVVLGDGEQEMLEELEGLANDNAHDESFQNKLNDYLGLDNLSLIKHFEVEMGRVMDEICRSERQDEIQAVFIEYDYYHHYTGCITCFGLQDYPIVEVPRYLTDEFDHAKQVLVVEDEIDFQPAWLDCTEFEDLDHLDIGFDLERLFQLHSRTLLFKALDNLNNSGILEDFKVRPFTFYINEHDSEVMMLYRLD